MIINHNLNAMNAHRQLGIGNAAASKSMEKLSSGYRINRAGDDAAGLAISEKMRAQIRGLNMASKNAQDGISLIQTAEGALNETHAILQRMRELAVQSSNDTNADIDRTAIQNEMNQLTEEIDRIGNTTEFNTKKLLNGGANVSATLGADLKDVVKVVGGSGDTKVGAELVITATTVADAATQSNASFFTNGALGADTDLVINGTKFSFASGTTTDEVLETINNAGLGVTATSSDDAELVLTTTAVGSAAQLTSDVATAGTMATAYGTDATVTTSTGEQYSAQGNTVTIETGDAKGLRLEVLDDAESLSGAGATATVEANGTLSLQIGANEGQDMNVGISDMRASALGVQGVDVTSATSAKSAITTIQKGIDKVSAERAKLGAAQNRLEHTIKNLDNTSENLQAAESRIRDVDMAKEMMEFTKNNILQQAAQAMLAQANNAPQGVLQLLR